MYENMVDVLIYLYENYMGSESRAPADQDALETELVEAGFSRNEIERALQWLDDLAEHVEVVHDQEHALGSIRIYNEVECGKLDVEARGLLLFLEQSGILDPASRELVIDRLLAIDHGLVTLEEVMWVSLLVLMSRPGHEEAFSRMEGMVYDDEPTLLH